MGGEIGGRNLDNMNVMVIMRGGANQLLRKLGWGGTIRSERGGNFMASDWSDAILSSL